MKGCAFEGGTLCVLEMSFFEGESMEVKYDSTDPEGMRVLGPAFRKYGGWGGELKREERG